MHPFLESKRSVKMSGSEPTDRYLAQSKHILRDQRDQKCILSKRCWCQNMPEPILYKKESQNDVGQHCNKNIFFIANTNLDLNGTIN